MAQLHLSRKQIKSPQDEALLVSSALNCKFPSKTNMDTRNSVINQATGIAVVAPLDDDVGDLEMLLESYFMQLDGIRNRILSVSLFIHTEIACIALYCWLCNYMMLSPDT